MQIESLADIFSIATTAILVLAVIGGGIWRGYIYWKRRERLPKAKLSQEVEAIRLTNDKICIYTYTRIENTGDVMISIRSAINTVYQILPLDDSIEKALKGEVEKLYGDKGTEIKWPGYYRKPEWGKGEFEIEPGEDDAVPFDLIIPANIQRIRVYTHFRNIAKRGRPIGWHIQGSYDVVKLLSGGGEQGMSQKEVVKKQQEAKPEPVPLREAEQLPKPPPKEPEPPPEK